MVLRVGAGLVLAGLWTAAVAILYDSTGWLARAVLAIAVLPLIALWLDLGRFASRKWIQDAAALSAPLGLFWALNHPALGAWWIRDDPCHLTLIVEHGLWRPFFHAIGFFLTPLLHFSLGLDLSLFGPEPRAFYGHQLISFSVLIVAGYGFLRAWMKPSGAGLALALFVASIPAFAVARLLMNRHYLEGLILALASLALYRRSVAGGRVPMAILAAGLYLLATAAKEVFVPLIVLLPFVAAGDRRRRWRHALPFVLAAGVYGLWRLFMLGWSNSLSGYGALGGEFRSAALSNVPQLLGLVEPWQLVIAAGAGTAAIVTLARRSRFAALGLGAGLVALAAPLVPVAARLEPRHLFLWAFAAAAVLAAALEAPARGIDRFAPLRALAGTLLLVLALASLARSDFRHHFGPALDHHRSEGRFVLEDSQTGLLLTTVDHSTFLECMAKLRRDVLGRPGGPGFCGDACYCSERLPAERLWRYADGRLVVVEEPAGAGCALGGGRALEIDLAHDRAAKRMSWTFGPYPDGAYEVLLISGAETPGVSIPVALPRQGSMPYWLFEPLRFVVRYRSPEGWQTYSPIYTVEPDGRATVTP